MIEKSILELEAKNLSERFASVENREEFAIKHGIPGRGAQIYQHMRAIRPISLKAAQAYAKAFGCSLAEISPRWAEATSSARSEPKVPLRPPIIEAEEWASLSAQRREFIEMVATGKISDNEIIAMQSMLEIIRATGIQKETPKKSGLSPNAIITNALGGNSKKTFVHAK